MYIIRDNIHFSNISKRLNFLFYKYIIMFQKIFIFIFILFFIVGCSSEESIIESSGLTLFTWDWYSISIPNNWDIITNQDKLLPEPSEGKIELSAQSESVKWGFVNNLLVLSDRLESFTDSSEYSISNNVWAQGEYIDYLELESENIEFFDGNQSQIYVFEAKYNSETPKLKFLQTAYVCNPNIGYFLTIAISPSVKDTEKYKTLLSTFSCTPDENVINI